MLTAISDNKKSICTVIKSIKLSNKLIRKLGKKIEKNIQKIDEREKFIEETEIENKALKRKRSLESKQEVEDLEKQIRIAHKSIKKIENELGLPLEKNSFIF